MQEACIVDHVLDMFLFVVMDVASLLSPRQCASVSGFHCGAGIRWMNGLVNGRFSIMVSLHVHL